MKYTRPILILWKNRPSLKPTFYSFPISIASFSNQTQNFLNHESMKQGKNKPFNIPVSFPEKKCNRPDPLIILEKRGMGVYDTKPLGTLYSTFSSLYYALSVSMTVMIYEIQYRCIFQRGLYFISSRHQNGQEVTRHTGRGNPSPTASPEGLRIISKMNILYAFYRKMLNS